jgi:hypothetical protein
MRLLTEQAKIQYRGSVPADIREKLAPRKLADILRLECDFVSAEALFKSVLQRFPDDTLSWYLLGRVYFDSHREPQLMQVCEQLRDCPEGDVFSKLLLATWRLQRNQVAAAGPLIDELIRAAPRMPFPRLLRIEFLARTAAPLAHRMQACRDLLRLHPANFEARQMLNQLELQHRQSASVPSGWTTSVTAGAGLSMI